MTASLMVLSVLLLLGWTTLHVVVERLLFHGMRRLATPEVLEQELAQWREGFPAVPKRGLGLGWLRSLLRQAKGDSAWLRRLCHTEKRQMLFGQAFLPMAADIATALGLLGTALALWDSADRSDVLTVLAEGMQKMIVGLLIAIPAFSVHALCGRRGVHLASQVDEVLRTLPSGRLGDRA